MAEHGTNGKVNWRDLPPVEHLVEVPRRPSQTFLGHHEVCDRMAYLWLKHGGGAGSHPMNRGSLFHIFAELATLELIAKGENMMPPKEAAQLMRKVLREHATLTVPAKERDALRRMAWSWAAGTWVDPERTVCVERLLELEIGEWTIRGKIDRAELDAFGHAEIHDYKTSWALPDSEEFASGGFDRDGWPRYGGDYQTQIYALLFAFGSSEGYDHPPGEGVERFHLFLDFPQYPTEEGIAYRDAWVTRGQLASFRDDLADQLARLEANEKTGKWQPTPGHHCGRCPAPRECPLPRHLRPDSQLEPGDTKAAEELATWLKFRQPETKRVQRRLREFTKREGLTLVRAGHDEAYVFEHTLTEKIKNKTKLRLAVEGAVEYGHPFDWEEHVTVSHGTRFKLQTVEPAQLDRGEAPDLEDPNNEEEE